MIYQITYEEIVIDESSNNQEDYKAEELKLIANEPVMEEIKAVEIKDLPRGV